MQLVVELLGKDLNASSEIRKVEGEVQRFGRTAAAASTEVGGFETVISRRLLPSLGLVGVSAGAVAGAGVLALGAAFATAARQGIEMDARLEQETLRFQSFGLSASQARQHVQELFDLGAATPFTAQQLIEGSRLLRTFGGAALDTRQNLTLLGDTSAATGADLNALSFWVGRLYADLQAGKPFGEAEQNLRQLAVLTPQAAQEMEHLAASGAPASETFAAFTRSLQGFGGAMEAQSHTLAGLTSTLSDNLSQLAGIAFAPAFEANKAALEGFNAALASGGARQTAQDVADVSQGIREMGSAWGGLPASLISWLTFGVAGAAPGAAGAALHGAAGAARAIGPQPRDASELTRAEGPLSEEAINMQQALALQGEELQRNQGFLLANEVALSHHAAAETAAADATRSATQAAREWGNANREGSGDVGRMTAAMQAQADAADLARRQVQTLVAGSGQENDEFGRRRGAVYTPGERAGLDRIVQGLQQNRRDWEEYSKEAARITEQNERERMREERQRQLEEDRQREQGFRERIGAERLGLGNEDIRHQILGLAAAPDRATQERELFDVERQRKEVVIDLQQAEHDANLAAQTALKERLSLLDQEITKIKQLGIEQAKQAEQMGGGGTHIGGGYGYGQTADPYHLYGGGPGAAPAGQHWDPKWMTFVPDAPTSGQGSGNTVQGDIHNHFYGMDPHSVAATVIDTLHQAFGGA